MKEEKRTAWSNFWAQGNLNSCIPTSKDNSVPELSRCWQQLLDDLDAKAKILDIATGNGSVPYVMLAHQPQLEITGVDFASIDKSVIEKKLNRELSNLSLIGETNIFETQFPEREFDAIVSQFGLEYAGVEEVIQHTLPFLKTGGVYAFVIHHSQSHLIQSSRRKITEMESLLSKGGLIESAKGFATKAKTELELETAGRAFLQAYKNPTQAISGQVFSGINLILNLSAQSRDQEIIALAEDIESRLKNELSRLQQLVEVAYDADSMSALITSLEGAGFTLKERRVIVSDERAEIIIGWFVFFEKVD